MDLVYHLGRVTKPVIRDLPLNGSRVTRLFLVCWRGGRRLEGGVTSFLSCAGPLIANERGYGRCCCLVEGLFILFGVAGNTSVLLRLDFAEDSRLFSARHPLYGIIT